MVKQGFTFTTTDEDLGLSGTGLQERVGFGRLLSAVCEGAAGAVLALETSRLARNIGSLAFDRPVVRQS